MPHTQTAQSIAVMECLRLVGGVAGPFLLVAPLTTLMHWQRECETWSDMVGRAPACVAVLPVPMQGLTSCVGTRGVSAYRGAA